MPNIWRIWQIYIYRAGIIIMLKKNHVKICFKVMKTALNELKWDDGAKEWIKSFAAKLL